MPELAYVNGEIMAIDQALVPIEDRGYQFGDAVYEFVDSYAGRLFRLEDHLERLQRSMEIIEFPPVDIDEIRNAILTFFEKSRLKRAGLYIQISRGVAKRYHPYPTDTAVQFIMTVREIPEFHPNLKTGVAVMTMVDFRWGRCDCKTVQLLPNVMAKQRALSAGLYDTIFITEEKVVKEGTSTNVFIMKGGKAITHPLTKGILPGITRKVILEICREQNLPFEERFYKTDELYGADEVFMTGTTTEVLPVVRVDDRPVGDGTIGPFAPKFFRKLREKGEV